MPNLPADATTFVLNGTPINDLVDGDVVSVTYANPQTTQINSGNNTTIQERKDAQVADVVVNVVKYSDSDVFLNNLQNTKQKKAFEGSLKTLYYKDDNETFETYQLTNGSFTAKPADMKNNTDGNALMTYTLRFSALRLI